MFYLKEGSLSTNTPVFQCLDGGLLFPERQIAYDFALHKNYEHHLINWALTMMDPTKTFVDIGAHVGTWTLKFASACERVHSFEATPRTFNYLCGNIALNGLDEKVFPHHVALGDVEGIMPLYKESDAGGGNSCLRLLGRTATWNVQMRTLDSFNLQNVGMIKIDVEGYEKQVLQGAQDTLRRCGYPKIFFESWIECREENGVPSKSLRGELFAYIESTGYTVVPVRGWSEMFIAEYTGTAPTTS
jgi:FkbM family methyltransferase